MSWTGDKRLVRLWEAYCAAGEVYGLAKPDPCVPNTRELYMLEDIRKLRDELYRANEIVEQWAKAAGWEVPRRIDTVSEALCLMRSFHCDERSEHDLAMTNMEDRLAGKVAP